MRVVIIGAGISGLAAYLSLKKHLPRPSSPAEDHVYTIYEAYSTDKDSTSEQRLSSLAPEAETGGDADAEANTHSSTLIVGGALGIGCNGVNVLKRLDPEILKDVVLRGYVVSRYNLKAKNGTVLMRFESQIAAASPKDAGSGADSGQDKAGRKVVNTVGTSRHSFWRCLRTRVPDEVIVNMRISEVVADPDGGPAVVRFVDGSEPVEADLVIGADGLKSTTKKALFPDMKDDAFPPRYEGLVGIGGFVPLTPDLRQAVGKGTMNFVHGGNGFFGYFPSTSSLSSPNRDSINHVSEPGDQLAWWSTYAMEECPTELREVDTQEMARSLRARHGNWSDPVIRQIINMETLQIKNIFPTWTAPELPIWHRDGVVLIGDAAHALPSTSGQGSSQALEDVEAFTLFLAHELRVGYKTPLQTQAAMERKAVTEAAQRYVDLRKPHVKKILDRSRQMQENKRDKSLFEEYAMYLFMWILGWFPSFFTKPMKEVGAYDIRAEVERILAQEDV